MPCRRRAAGGGAIFIGDPSLESTIQPQTRLPTLAADSSSPVMTASTPGIAIAAAAVNSLDPGVGVWGADDVGLGLSGPVKISNVAALAGNKSLILGAAHGGANLSHAHGSPPSIRFEPKFAIFETLPLLAMSLWNRLEQLPRLFEYWRVQAFSEPVVDRRYQISGFCDFALVPP